MRDLGAIRVASQRAAIREFEEAIEQGAWELGRKIMAANPDIPWTEVTTANGREDTPGGGVRGAQDGARQARQGDQDARGAARLERGGAEAAPRSET